MSPPTHRLSPPSSAAPRPVPRGSPSVGARAKETAAVSADGGNTYERSAGASHLGLYDSVERASDTSLRFSAPTHAHVHGRGPGAEKADLGRKKKYDTTVMNGGGINRPLSSEARKHENLEATHSGLDEALSRRFPGGITFDPPLADPKGPHAADVKHALLRSLNDEKGSHQDRVVDLNGTRNMVSANVDKEGAVKVKLHGPGAPAVPSSSTFKTVEEAAKALEADFGVKVSDSPKAFKLDELNKAHAAFSKMTEPAEKEALKGITLERHTRLPDASRSAEFEGKVEPGPPPKHTKTMRIADDTFLGDGNGFVGNGTAGGSVHPSVATLLHEAGHALDNQKAHAALHHRNVAVDNHSNHLQGHNRAGKAYYDQVSGQPLDAASLAVNRALVDVDRKTNALLRATTEPTRKAAARALQQAIARRDAALGRLSAGAPAETEAKAYAQSQDTNAELSGQVAKASVAEKAATSGQKSQRLADFEAFLKRNKIPPFTDYAKSGGTEEFFAEAYMLHKTDPEWMKTNSPKLYDYFQKDQHLG